MKLRHRPVVVDGERVGDLVTLERKVVFYTTHPALAHLDGGRFDSFADAMKTIQASLAHAKAA